MPLYFLTNCRMQCDTMERPLLFLSVLKMTPDIYRGDSAEWVEDRIDPSPLVPV
jgi:hypothetical protein